MRCRTASVQRSPVCIRRAPAPRRSARAPSTSCPSASSSASKPWKIGANSCFPYPRRRQARRSSILRFPRRRAGRLPSSSTVHPSPDRARSCVRLTSRGNPAVWRTASGSSRSNGKGSQNGRRRPGLGRAAAVGAPATLLVHHFRPVHLAQGPACEGEVARRGGGGVHTESELGVPIALRIVYPQRLGRIGSVRRRDRPDRDTPLPHCGAPPPPPSSVPRFRPRAGRSSPFPPPSASRRATCCRAHARNSCRMLSCDVSPAARFLGVGEGGRRFSDAKASGMTSSPCCIAGVAT